jgi:hypothetical protein
MTRRQRGWAYAGVAAAVLAAWPLSKLSLALAERSLAKSAPAPVATIDEPAANAAVGVEVTVKGRAVHETIRGWLWLLSSEAGGEWKPEGGPIATGAGTWQKLIFMSGRKGMHYRLAVIAAEIPLHERLKEKLRALESPPPWHLYRFQEEGGGRGIRDWENWEHAPLGDGKTYPPLPDGAALVTVADIVAGDRKNPFSSPAEMGKYTVSTHRTPDRHVK